MSKRLLTLCLVILTLVGVVPTFAQSPTPVVKIGNNVDLGDILVANNGLTLYTFANDSDGKATCEGDCAGSWPPYIIEDDSELTAEAGITGALGTTQRTDGSQQLTFDGKPVYFFIADTEPGQATGEGAGGVWYTVRLEVSAEAPVADDAPPPSEDDAVDVPVGDAIIFSEVNDALGTILVASNGMTLYTFNNDELGKSNCVAACATLWPPLLTDSEAISAGEGVPGTIGVLAREDGTQQVTLNERPLYFYSKDVNPGDVNGQGVGNVWFSVALDSVRAVPNEVLGSILATADGRTLYTFNNDELGKSNCIAACADLWPAFTVDSEDADLVAGKGVGGELTILTRDDGTFQVMLNERPLYFFSKDENPGDTNGQGVGDVWFTVSLDTVRIAAHPTAGNILAAANGLTLYRFANDEPGWSNCVGECSATWPPLVVEDETALGTPLGLVGTLATSQRADGTFQVTFDDQPLYFFAGDKAPGETNGDGVGGVWSVVTVQVDATLVPVTLVTCQLTIVDFDAVNIRIAPTTEGAKSREVAKGDVLVAIGQIIGDDTFVWFQLEAGDFVRSDVVSAEEACQNLPLLTS